MRPYRPQNRTGSSRHILLKVAACVSMLVMLGACLGPDEQDETPATTETASPTPVAPTPLDPDGDGFVQPEDCEPLDSAISPNAQEHCDGVDNNCDGDVDGADAVEATVYYRDWDGDGFGDPAVRTRSCQLPAGYVTVATDCDDAQATVSPASEEICANGQDDNCDGTANDCGLQGTASLGSVAAVLSGELPGDWAGSSLAGAGDVDMDGEWDLLVGAPYHDRGGSNAGVAYLVKGPVSGNLPLENAQARILGIQAGAMTGLSVAGAGDVNGDGYDDVLIGAPYQDSTAAGAGLVALFLGPLVGTFEINDADALFAGEAAGDAAGYAVSGAGDVNADGFDDILIGAWGNDANGEDAGAAYLFYGPLEGPYLLSEAPVIRRGEARGDLAGYTVAAPGDLNGDGRDDLLIGAPLNDSGGLDSGVVYTLLGPLFGELGLGVAKARLVGEAAGDNAGRSLARGPDETGDGIPELLIGAPGSNRGAQDAGAIYVVDGTTQGTVNLVSALGIVTGDVAGDHAGRALASAGDVNDDGKGDILVSTLSDGTSSLPTGAAWLLYGSLWGVKGGLSSLGVRIGTGDPDALVGYAVLQGSDSNADGYGDILVSAPDKANAQNYAGAVYLFQGGAGW